MAKDPEKRKAAQREYHRKNRERLLARMAENRARNREEQRRKQRERYATDEVYREARLAYVRQWRAEHPERSKASNSAWNERNRERWFAAIAQRAKQRRQATPAWADRRAILALYEEAKRLTRATGVEYHVDHIIPLKGKWVCGLHVWENLRIVTRAVNQRKANRFLLTAPEPLVNSSPDAPPEPA
jgi:hypothetical protein